MLVYQERTSCVGFLCLSLSTQVYKWEPANLMLRVTQCDRLASHPAGRVQILPVASCHKNREKLQPDGPLGSHADYDKIWVVGKTLDKEPFIILGTGDS